ncbi:hypothetical protein SAMN05444164_7573 [Bradyrhizobium erythrophlei]|uniref:Uncharacterized protein n=3 Tax=Bradyrhizobium TaxID=374 RepID=A0A1H5HNR3_9BRAD|nr:hypothetical protein SAMN05444164_7573 [Bradyrhizobium erythrophlei]
MMSRNNATMIASKEQPQTPSPQPDMSEEARSKDAFFIQLAEITEAMIAAHGKDFATGALVLSAKFVAEGKPLIKRASGG